MKFQKIAGSVFWHFNITHQPIHFKVKAPELATPLG